MRVLLDECVDPRVATLFSSGISVSHLKDEGWLGMKNGDLVLRAATKYDALFTVERNMPFQTSLRNIELAVFVGIGLFRGISDFKVSVVSFERHRDQLVKGSYFFQPEIEK